VSAPTVAIATLGCRLNQVDSRDLATRLEQRGFRMVPFESPADVVVVNSCTVTGRADVSNRQMIRRARRRGGPRVVVTGCWAQTDPDAVAAMRDVDAVVGNADKHRLPDIVEELLALRGARPEGPRIISTDIHAVTQLTPPAPPRPSLRARAFLKVQEGCQHRCAFCIVPIARGVSRSLAPSVVLDHARRLVELGHPEIVLTGVDLGRYGADLVPRTTLAALVRELTALRGLSWLRLSSVLPAYFSEELVDVVTSAGVVAPHLHIPLQSGSDRVLRAMRRPYNVAMYRRLVDRLAASLPRLGLGADVIVGFPGESDADFAATMALVESLPFSYLHVFGYSDRRGTEAAVLRGHVDARTIAARSAALRALAARKNQAYRHAMVGQIREALVLETRDRATGALVGLTDDYVEVLFEGADELMRTITHVRIRHVAGERTSGESVRARPLPAQSFVGEVSEGAVQAPPIE
jgi:threonylcarbamoyladenosine tRNA methylthiotransferase MtaB